MGRDPEEIEAWGDKLAADFGAGGRGLWIYESDAWT